MVKLPVRSYSVERSQRPPFEGLGLKMRLLSRQAAWRVVAARHVIARVDDTVAIGVFFGSPCQHVSCGIVCLGFHRSILQHAVSAIVVFRCGCERASVRVVGERLRLPIIAVRGVVLGENLAHEVSLCVGTSSSQWTDSPNLHTRSGRRPIRAPERDLVSHT